MDTPSAVPPPPPMTVDRTQPCVKCGYDLRGLPLTGVCPECGSPVEDSLRGLVLQFASAQYRGKLKRGLSLILNGILLQIGLMVLGFGVVLAFPGSRMVMLGLSAAGLGVTVMLMLGYWLFTEPDPGYTGIEKPKSARQVARIAVAVQAVIQVVQLVMSMADDAVGAVSGTSGGFTLVSAVSGLLTLAALAAWATQFFAVMLYTRWLGSRVPDAHVASKSKTYMWLLPVLTTLGILLLGFGPLIALILYWNLLDRLRKHVKAIEATGAPAPLSGR